MEKIRAIESDASLTDREKAKQRQELLGGAAEAGEAKDKGKEANAGGAGGVLGILGDKFNCSICMQLLDRPVSVRFFFPHLSSSANFFCVFEFFCHFCVWFGEFLRFLTLRFESERIF